MRNLTLLYLFTALASGKINIFVCFCATFPFFIPVMFYKNEHPKKLLLKCLACGISGVAFAVIVAGIFGVLSAVKTFSAAILAFLLCAVIVIAQKRVKPAKLNMIRVACIMFIFIICLNIF